MFQEVSLYSLHLALLTSMSMIFFFFFVIIIFIIFIFTKRMFSLACNHGFHQSVLLLACELYFSSRI